MSINEALRDELVLMAERDQEHLASINVLADGDARLREELMRRLTAASAGGAALAEWCAEGSAPPEVVAYVDIHARNNTRLREIVAEQGWPGRSAVGPDAADAAWLLAQHLDEDPALRWECVRLLEEAVAARDADPRHLAALTDRALRQDGRPQRFGTIMSIVDGSPVFSPALERPDDLDAIRASIGLPRVNEEVAQGVAPLMPYRSYRVTSLNQWPA